MLFLYRPRQTWTPYPPRQVTDQDAYNRRMQDAYDATRRVVRSEPKPDDTTHGSQRDTIGALKDLAELYSSGFLNDAEFAQVKAKILRAGE